MANDRNENADVSNQIIVLRNWMTIFAAFVVVMGGVLGGLKWIVTQEVAKLQLPIRELQMQVGVMEVQVNALQAQVGAVQAQLNTMQGQLNAIQAQANVGKLSIEDVFSLPRPASGIMSEEMANQVKRLIEQLKSSGAIPDDFDVESE